MTNTMKRASFKTLVKYGTLLICFTMFTNCAVPITTGTKYPIDVFMENENPDRPYSEIREVEISSEDSLSREQLHGDRTTKYRGKSSQDKELLKAQLVLKAQKLGADAIVRVKYQYFATAKSEGFSIKGIAVRYRGE
jgi:uncharacterized protein YbjQ (UPF0145 family)